MNQRSQQTYFFFNLYKKHSLKASFKQMIQHANDSTIDQCVHPIKTEKIEDYRFGQGCS